MLWGYYKKKKKKKSFYNIVVKPVDVHQINEKKKNLVADLNEPHTSSNNCKQLFVLNSPDGFNLLRRK